MGWRTEGERGYPAGLDPNPTVEPMIQRLDHVGIAVTDLGRAVGLWRGVFGGQFILGGDDHQLGMRTMMFKLPNLVKVELLFPIRDDSYMARYIERRGEGFHHATIFVDDVVETIEELTGHGYEVVDTELSDPHWRETYIRPKSANGCLIQVVDSTLEWLDPHPVCTPEAVMAGEWRWWGGQVWHVDRLPEDYSDEPSTAFLPGGESHQPRPE